MSEISPQNPQRRLVLKTVTASAIAMGLVSLREALAQGGIPPGLYRVQGRVSVNGKPAKRGQVINPGDRVETGSRSQAVFVIGQDAFILRALGRVETSGSGAFADVLRLATGKLLSVFSAGPRRIETPTATIGIRGTGLYLESGAKRTYVCTCYGTVEVAPRDLPKMTETITTTHHEQPRYVYADSAMPEDRMMPRAPVINHTDAELILLESLVGREPPFVGKGAPPY